MSNLIADPFADNGSDDGTETLDLTLNLPADADVTEELEADKTQLVSERADVEDEDETIAEFLHHEEEEDVDEIGEDMPDDEEVYNWEDIIDGESGLPVPLLLQEKLRYVLS